MKRNLNIVIHQYDGTPMYRPEVLKDEVTGLPKLKDGMPQVAGYVPITLKMVVCEALAGRWPGEENLPLDTSYKRGELCVRVAKSDEVELELGDINMILEAVKAQRRDHFVLMALRDLLTKD